MHWQKETEVTFHAMIEKVPVFLRLIAQEKVFKKAESLVLKENRQEVIQKDLVDAFFLVTPFGFHGPLKQDLSSLGIEYTHYGYNK